MPTTTPGPPHQTRSAEPAAAITPLARQIRPLGRLLVVLCPVGAAMLAAQKISFRYGYELSFLTRDTSWALGGPFFAGWISSANAMVWCAAAVVCLFSSALVRRGEWSTFLLWSGLLSLLLGVDDLFMLHDGLFPWLFGIGDRPTFAAYGLLTLLWLWVFRRTILRTNYVLLGIALALFAVSVLADRRFVAIAPHRLHLLEDGAKLLGVTAWCFYFATTAFGVVRRGLPGPK
jgi:hypothetical protein